MDIQLIHQRHWIWPISPIKLHGTIWKENQPKPLRFLEKTTHLSLKHAWKIILILLKISQISENPRNFGVYHGFPMAFTSAMCFSGRAGRRDAAAPAAGHVAGQGAGAAAVPVAQLELGKRRWENAGILGDSYGIMAWFMGLLWVWDYFGNYSWNYWDILGLWILWDMNIGYWDIVLVVLHHGYFFWDAGIPIGSLWCESIIGESVNIHLWWYYWITMGLLWDYYGMIYGVHYGIIKQSSFITIMSPYFLGFWDYSRNYLGNYVCNYDYSHIIIGITVVIIIPHDFLGWWDYGTMMGIH